MYYFLLILGFLTLLSGIIPLVFTYRLRKYIDKTLRYTPPNYTPKVSLILPCKGLDPGFEENIKAHLKQDYPDYEIIFVTATEDDPAYVALSNSFRETPSPIPVKIIVAGISPIRGQKINNMLEALKNAHVDTEVFAFVDSDIRPKKHFLSNLVQPLQFPNVGATTGMRWYLPSDGKLGSMLRSIWTAGAYPLLIDKRHNFTWGGAIGIKKEIFKKASIAQLLNRALNDSFAVTNGVKKLGLDIVFVPKCIAVSHEDSTLAQTLEFTNRQTITTRVYCPTFWWTVFLTYCFSNIMLIIGISFLVISILGKGYFFLPSLLMLSLIPLEIFNAAYLIPAVQKVIPEYSQDIEKLKWKYYIATPLASVLILINSLVSLTTNEFTWRGVRYRLVSPTHTEILSKEE